VTKRRPLTKSEQMARVRTRDTAPELALRRELWRRGWRYRKHPQLPGTPDFAFLSRRIAVFVDGCFWHGCPDHYTAPVANADYWREKVERNRQRDIRADAALGALGWQVVRLWEHELRDIERAVERVMAPARHTTVRTVRG
jgi:DNA mismatch endonuclease, patch repair protein